MDPITEPTSGGAGVTSAAASEPASSGGSLDLSSDRMALLSEWADRQEAGTPPANPDPSTPAQPAAGTEPQAATGSEIPGGQVLEPKQNPVPYDRFKQVVDERNNLREFEPFIQACKTAGLTQEQAMQRLMGISPAPAAPATPAAQDPAQSAQSGQSGQSADDRYHAWLTGRGIDPLDLDDASYDLRRTQFEAQDALDQLRQERQTAAQQRQQAAEERDAETFRQTAQLDMAKAVQQYPVLANPAFQRAVYAQYGLELDNGGTRTLAEIAAEQAAELNGFRQREIDTYAQKKSGHADTPVVTGGGAPAPESQPKLGDLSATQRLDRIQSYMDAARG